MYLTEHVEHPHYITLDNRNLVPNSFCTVVLLTKCQDYTIHTKGKIAEKEESTEWKCQWRKSVSSSLNLLKILCDNHMIHEIVYKKLNGAIATLPMAGGLMY